MSVSRQVHARRALGPQLAGPPRSRAPPGSPQPPHPPTHICGGIDHPHPTPSNIHSSPSNTHPSPYTRHPTPFTPHPTPYTLHPTPYTLHATPNTLHPAPYRSRRSRATRRAAMRRAKILLFLYFPDIDPTPILIQGRSRYQASIGVPHYIGVPHRVTYP